MRKRWLVSVLIVFLWALPVSLAAQTAAQNVTGKWQISWEARIGTERDTIDLTQSEGKLSGTFHGKLGPPQVSGNVDGNHITLRLDFPGTQPYSLVFSGVVEGEKMSGKFEVPGVDKAYDWHGENVRPSNYTWSAVRQSEAHAPDPAAATNPPRGPAGAPPAKPAH
jgi:hypothetical protein